MTNYQQSIETLAYTLSQCIGPTYPIVRRAIDATMPLPDAINLINTANLAYVATVGPILPPSPYRLDVHNSRLSARIPRFSDWQGRTQTHQYAVDHTLSFLHHSASSQVSCREELAIQCLFHNNIFALTFFHLLATKDDTLTIAQPDSAPVLVGLRASTPEVQFEYDIYQSDHFRLTAGALPRPAPGADQGIAILQQIYYCVVGEQLIPD